MFLNESVFFHGIIFFLSYGHFFASVNFEFDCLRYNYYNIFKILGFDKLFLLTPVMRIPFTSCHFRLVWFHTCEIPIFSIKNIDKFFLQAVSTCTCRNEEFSSFTVEPHEEDHQGTQLIWSSYWGGLVTEVHLNWTVNNGTKVNGVLRPGGVGLRWSSTEVPMYNGTPVDYHLSYATTPPRRSNDHSPEWFPL
jgi:hypothetical protein